MALSGADLYNLFRAQANAARVAAGMRELAFRPGDHADALALGVQAMAEAVLGEAAQQAKDHYLDGAEGDALSTWGADRWDTLGTRFPAIKATGEVSFTRAVNGPGGTIAAGTVVATERDVTGKETRFITDADLVWALNEQATKTVLAYAELTGPDGNAAAATIVRIVSSLFDNNFTVTNAAAFVGGDDIESEDNYRARLRDIPRTLRRATLEALETGARQVPSVKRATAEAELDPISSIETGVVNLYVSDDSGASSPQMVADVEAILPQWEAAGATINVIGATVVMQAITLTLTVRTGVVVDTTAVKAAVARDVNRGRINETLDRSTISTAAKNVDPNGIIGVTISIPAGAVVPNDGEIIRTSTDMITVA